MASTASIASNSDVCKFLNCTNLVGYTVQKRHALINPIPIYPNLYGLTDCAYAGTSAGTSAGTYEYFGSYEANLAGINFQPVNILVPYEYCKEHECMFHGCHNKRHDTYQVCIEHKCTSPDCQLPIRSNSVKCQYHGCSISDCCDESYNELGICLGHKCMVDLCQSPRMKNGLYCAYCERYKCSISECNRIRKKDSIYCAIH